MGSIDNPDYEPERILTPSDQRKIGERLLILQQKQNKAREQRDKYIEYIRLKYPNYKIPNISRRRVNSKMPPLNNNNIFASQIDYMGGRGNCQPYLYQGNRLIEQLETSKYFWNSSHSGNGSVNDVNSGDMIALGGIVLHSEMPRAMTKISQIKSDLQALRQYRLNMGRDEYLKSQGLIDNKLALSNSRSENKSFIPVVNNGSGGGFNEMKEKSSLMDLRSQIINLAIDIEAKAQSKSDQREEDILLNGAKLGLGDLEKNNPVPFVGREEEKLENLGVSSQNKLLPNNGVINVPTTNTTNIDKKKEDEVVVRPVISFDGPLSNNNKRVSTPPLKVETKKAEINLADILNVPITRKESDKKGSEPNKAKEESFLDTLFGGRPVKPVYSPNVVSPSPAKIVQNKKEQITDEDSDDDFFT